MKRVEDLEVIGRRPAAANTMILTLRSPSPLPEIRAGQFVNVRVDTPDVFLRRPISIHDCRPKDCEIDLWIQDVGKGSHFLCSRQEGDLLNLIYPLGNGFTLPSQTSSCLLIGGGCGVAPLLLLARRLHEQNHRVTILIGARTKAQIGALDAYVRFGTVHPITQDGSLGQTGLVIDHPILEQQRFDQIFCCGPTPMMREVNRIAQNKNIPCQVSLENTMACGIGACLCCVTPTTEGHRCVCTYGPVFSGDQLCSL